MQYAVHVIYYVVLVRKYRLPWTHELPVVYMYWNTSSQCTVHQYVCRVAVCSLRYVTWDVGSKTIAWRRKVPNLKDFQFSPTSRSVPSTVLFVEVLLDCVTKFASGGNSCFSINTSRKRNMTSSSSLNEGLISLANSSREDWMQPRT